MSTRPGKYWEPIFGSIAWATGLGSAGHWVWIAVCLSLSAPELLAKSIIFEGFVENAPTSFQAPVTHVMRFFPGERIEVALVDARRSLASRPFERVRVLGTLASDRVVNGVPMIRVEEVWPADWSQPLHTLCPVTAANWNGCGSSFYPSLQEEPLPDEPFVPSSSPPRDSDADGVPDYLDAFPNDPAETADTDGDGVGNNADTDDDNDLMPDAYELANGLKPLVKDATGDLDGDGMINLAESIAGTAANDFRSLLRFESIVSVSRNEILLTWQSVPGKHYHLLGGDRPEGPYDLIESDLPADGPTRSQSIDPARIRYRFFIVEVVSP